MKIKRLLIANRGEIACRIARTCKERGIKSVAIYTPHDKASLHRRSADEAIELSFKEAPLGYLDIKAICRIAKAAKVDAIHPGYGFLSENSAFAKAVADAGIKFIGPSAKSIEISGDKILAKEQATKCKVPCIPGVLLDEKTSAKQLETAKKFVKKNGLPVMAKAAAGGGGRGMRQVHSEDDLAESLEAASREAKALFGDGRIFLEKLVEGARHIEVQILADSSGKVKHLWDRDCSFQRKHQKLIEEAPAPNIDSSTRKNIHQAAVSLLESIGYESAATVEFLLGNKNEWYFLEVNSRLQVEHPVTEKIFELDLVGLQIDIAEGKPLTKLLPKKLEPNGHAIEFRICAEKPFEGFQPAHGVLHKFEAKSANSPGSSLRFDTGFVSGDRVGLNYDSMLGKLIVHSETREQAVSTAKQVLQDFTCFGLESNISYLYALLATKEFFDVTHSVNTAESLQENFKLSLWVPILSAIFAFGSKPTNGSLWKTCVQKNLSLRVLGSNVATKVTYLGSSQVRVDYDDTTFNLELDPQDQTYRINSERFTYELLRPTSQSAWIRCHLGNFFIEKHSEPLKENSEQDNVSPLIKAHLPGKVLKLHVGVDMDVSAEQALVSIESMKMEHVLRAPLAGKVVKLPVSEGSLVESSEVLVELEYSA